MRKFSSSKPKEPFVDGAEPITFTVDDDEWTANVPTAGEMALLFAAQSDSRDTGDAVAATIDFVYNILTPEDRRRYRERLLDPDDTFDFDTVSDILTGLMEEWGDRPTQSSGGSTPTRGSTGKRSTAKRRTKE